MGPLLPVYSVWRLALRPAIDAISIGAVDFPVTVKAIVAFCRPHTVKGTVLASLSGYTILAVYFEASALHALTLVLLSGITANIFIVGVNQLADVESDRTNKKPLPIATGELSWEIARDITGASLVTSITVGFIQSSLWGWVITGMCLIGYVYSVPPLRLKRFALPAALCIVTARAVLATIGGTFVFADAMGKSLDAFALFHLKLFTSVISVFATVIALMKDIPDMEGDREEGVQSLSIMVGPTRVLSLCYGLLSSMYVVVVAMMANESSLSVFTHLYGLLWLHGVSTRDITREGHLYNYHNVLWPLFYYEFLAYLIPVVCQKYQVEVPLFVLSLVLGAELGYISYMPSTVSGPDSTALCSQIKNTSGLDVSRIHRNLRLKGIDPTTHVTVAGGGDADINQAAVEVCVALSLHSKLSRLSGKVYTNAKNLGILCGDWLLARAVVALCATKDQAAIHEMGKAIAAATQLEKEEEIVQTVMKHADGAHQ